MSHNTVIYLVKNNYRLCCKTRTQSKWVNYHQDVKCLVAEQYLEYRRSPAKFHLENFHEMIYSDQLLKKITIKRGPQGRSLVLSTVLFLTWSLWKLLQQIPLRNIYERFWHWVPNTECLAPLRKIFPLRNKPFGTVTEISQANSTLGVSFTRLHSIVKISLE